MNPFLLVTFADLKKYVYHYWFAFPALVSKPGWELDGDGMMESSLDVSRASQRLNVDFADLAGRDGNKKTSRGVWTAGCWIPRQRGFGSKGNCTAT